MSKLRSTNLEFSIELFEFTIIFNVSTKPNHYSKIKKDIYADFRGRFRKQFSNKKACVSKKLSSSKCKFSIGYYMDVCLNIYTRSILCLLFFSSEVKVLIYLTVSCLLVLQPEICSCCCSLASALYCLHHNMPLQPRHLALSARGNAATLTYHTHSASA